MLQSMAERWKLNYDQLGILLGLEPNEAYKGEELLRGDRSPYGKDQKARIRHLLAIYGLLQTVFRDVGEAHKWLTEKKAALRDESPMERMLNGELEDILAVRRLAQTIAGQ
jgi:hypothetical protein